MHLSVIYIDADVARERACKRSLIHLVIDTLEDCWHEAGINCTTDDTVVELKLTAPWKVELFLALDVENGLLAVNLEPVAWIYAFLIRSNQQMNLTELAGTTRLFLVTVVCTGNLCDGLPV